MPTAVLDLDLQQLPAEISGLDGYEEAYILVRYKGRPVGKAMIPVFDGRISIPEYRTRILNEIGPVVANSWLHDYVGWDERSVTDPSPSNATIAICTRDRPDDLRRCLDALLRLPDDGQEIVVIDNCPSTSATFELVKSYPGVRYVLEKRPGLDIARNRALQEAQHEIVAFTDDDAVPDPNWLRAILSNFTNPLVLCVTGLTVPLELETKAQEAFEKYSPFDKGFRRKIYNIDTCNPLSTGQVGAGANMALRRSVLEQVGYFDEALDAGTPTQSGGDHEFFARILLAGYTIIYDPAALSWHRHRRTWEETRKAIRGYGIGVYAYWTRLLFVEKELGIVRFPWLWFVHTQLPNLVRSLFRRPASQPLELVLAELKGCVLGPRTYFASRKRLRNMSART